MGLFKKRKTKNAKTKTWATPAEFCASVSNGRSAGKGKRSDRDVILTDRIRLAPECAGNVLIFGSSGKGKARFVELPNLLQMNGSFAVVDTGGALFDNVGDALYRNGYDVKVLDVAQLYNNDFSVPLRGDTYNPLAYCRSVADILTLVNTLIDGAFASPKPADPFWKTATVDLLCALIGVLTERTEGGAPYAQIPEVMGEHGTEPSPSLLTVSDMLKMGAKERDLIFENVRNYETHRQQRDSKGIVAPHCLTAYDRFTGLPENVRNQTIVSAIVALKFLDIASVRSLMSTDSLSLGDFAAKKTALFITIPFDTKPCFLVPLLIAQLHSSIEAFGDCKVRGSAKVCLSDGETIGWFSKEDVERLGIERMSALIAAARIEEDAAHGCFAIVDGEGGTLTRRPTREEAESLLADIVSSATVKRLPSGSTPWRTTMFIDECCCIGKISGLNWRLATSRNTRWMLMFQTAGQFERTYPKEAEDILACCSTVLFLGVHHDDVQTLELVEKRTGRPLSELTALPFGSAVVTGLKGAASIDKRYDVTAHPRFWQTKDGSATESRKPSPRPGRRRKAKR